MKTIKALIGLAIALAVVLLVEFGVTLLPCERHSELRRETYEGLRADWRAVWG